MPNEKQITLEEAREALAQAKVNLSEEKGEFRKWKKANKIRNFEKITDEKLKAEYQAWEEKIAEATKAKEEAQAVLDGLKPKKGSGVGGQKYTYGTYINPETGEEVKVTAKTKDGKRWRTHARKEAKKLGIEPHQVEWDPNFFLPKVKKDKKVKSEKEETKDAPESKAPKGKAPEKKVRKKRS